MQHAQREDADTAKNAPHLDLVKIHAFKQSKHQLLTR